MDKSRLTKKLLTVSLLAAGLAACSGANNQINSSAGGTDSSTLTQCGASQNCVRIEFIDDPVINLNYSCSPVVNVTDETGVAVCPVNSRVEFYLQSTKSKRRVVLGAFVVQPPKNLRSDLVLLRATPLDFLSNRAEITQLSDSKAAAAINITRFLQALREHDSAKKEIEPFIDTAPVNRIRITNALKDQLDVLTEDVSAGDFGSDQFLTKLKPFFDATARTPISAQQAQTRLLNTLKAVRTGVYYGTPAITLPSSVGGGTVLDGLTGDALVNDLRLGIEGQAEKDTQSDNSGLLRSTLALFSLIDRDGAHIGNAMQWTGRANTPEGVYNLYRQNDFERLIPVTSLGGFDPITDKVNGQWQWRSVTTPQKIVDFNSGRLVRNLAMPGSETLYTNLTDDKPAPAGTIGGWVQRAVSVAKPDGTVETLPEINGTATISRAMSVNSFFDRTVWRTKDTIDSGRFVFPLHMTLRFRYGNTQNGCPQGGCTDLPNLSVTILENGNIISDFSADQPALGAPGNCLAVDPISLKDSAGVQEYRVGVVRAAYTGVNPQDAFIGPTMLFSGSVFGAHDGLQIATLATSPRVKINVAGPISDTPSPIINITDSSRAENEREGQDPAAWVNVYNTFLASRITTNLTDAQKQPYIDAAKKLQGTVTATVTPCYNTLNRTKPAPVSN